MQIKAPHSIKNRKPTSDRSTGLKTNTRKLSKINSDQSEIYEKHIECESENKSSLKINLNSASGSS